MVNHRCNNMRVVWEELPIEWSFSCQFPEEFKDIVREAAEYWNQIIFKEAFLETNICDSGLVVHDASEADTVMLGAVNYGAWCYKPVKEWLWSMMLFEGWFNAEEKVRVKVARHEFGHALGLDHTPELGCLMYPWVYDDKLRECDAEITAVRKVYGH